MTGKTWSTKTCTRCGLTKRGNAFATRTASKDGKQAWCRLCNAEQQGSWVERNRAHVNASANKRYAMNPAPRRLATANYRDRHRERLTPIWKEKRRAITLKAYGLTPTEYDRILTSQNNACAICESSDPNHWSGQFHVDHDHATYQVRGLLCHSCNTGLGSFRDDIGSLQSAVAYLCTAICATEKVAS